MFSADPKTDVQGAFAAWDAAFNKGDLKGIAAAYLPNAKLLPPNHEIALGREAIERFYAGVLANSITAHQLELIDAAGNEKIVYSSARWNAKGKDKDGQVTTFSGFATHGPGIVVDLVPPLVDQLGSPKAVSVAHQDHSASLGPQRLLAPANSLACCRRAQKKITAR